MNNFLGIILMTFYIVIVLALSKFVSKYGEEASRKFVHIMLCNVWFFIIYFFDSVIWASILPALFVIINSLSYKFKIIKSIEREQSDGFGTVYYAISLLIMCIFTFLVQKPILGLTGALVMGYGDGFAAIIGKRVKSPKYKVGNTTKTIAGSATMLLISFVVCVVILKILGVNYFIFKAIMISIIFSYINSNFGKGLK